MSTPRPSLPPGRHPDDVDDIPQSLQLKCDECGWIDDFTEESLNREGCAEGYCNDCETHRIFIKP